MKKLLLFFFLSFLGFHSFGQNKFENEVLAYEAKDKINMPRPGMRLFIGSSTFRIWKSMYEDLLGFNVINRGIGGSELSDILYYYDRMVKKYRPSWIFLYEGDNDLGNGKTAVQVHKDFIEFVSRVRRDLPKTKIVFVGIKPSILRFKLVDVQRNLHELIQQDQKKYKNLYFLDTHSPFFNSNGELIQDVFMKDGLHLNEKGYGIFSGEILKFLRKHPN